MFGSIVHRLARKPWSLVLVAGLVVLVGAAFLVAQVNEGSLFGVTLGGMPGHARSPAGVFSETPQNDAQIEIELARRATC